MGPKERVMIIILFFALFAAGGMLYYEQVYLKNKPVEGEAVFVAIEEIEKGEKIDKDSIGVMYLDPSKILSSHITDLKDLEDNFAKSTIYKNDFFTENNIYKEDEYLDDYLISVTPKNVTNFKKGDVVNIYTLVKDRDTSISLDEEEDSDNNHKLKNEKDEDADKLKDKKDPVSINKVVENAVVQAVEVKQSAKSTEEKAEVERLYFYLDEKEALSHELAKAFSDDNIIVLPQKNKESEIESIAKDFMEAQELDF